MENHNFLLFLLGRLDLVKLTQSWLDSSSSARFCGSVSGFLDMLEQLFVIHLRVYRHDLIVYTLQRTNISFPWEKEHHRLKSVFKMRYVTVDG